MAVTASSSTHVPPASSSRLSRTGVSAVLVVAVLAALAWLTHADAIFMELASAALAMCL
ncbi:MAG: hypothetical protein ACRCTD_13735 [Beijerinckiaceae bacterium]